MKMIRLPFRVRKPVLACGADMKGAFALAKGDTAYLEDGFGDLADPGNLERYEKAVGALGKKLKIKPAVIVCDMHPGYFSTRFATRRTGHEIYRVQHHEAHIASAIVDNALRGDVVGVAFDGTGFGTDGCGWGGEFFVGSPKRFTRAAHLEYVPMPGGDAAVREPWRMAASYLYRAFGSGFPEKSGKKEKALFIKAMIDKGIHSPLTSSAGRLFDAVASIVLKKDKAVFEAQLPVELEKTVRGGCEERYSFDIVNKPGGLIISFEKVFRAIMRDISHGTDRSLIAGRFHNTVAEVIAKTAARLAARAGLKKVVLSGGVFQNDYLRRRTTRLLEKDGFLVYRHHSINTNDSGIPIGQIAISAARGICV